MNMSVGTASTGLSSKTLIDCVRFGTLADVREQLGRSPKAHIDRLSDLEVNALHVAVWRNRLGVMRMLLEAGASPNIQDGESGWTALHRALYFGHLQAAGLLLSHGASLTVEDYRGRSPIDLLSANSQKWLKQPLVCDEASPEGAECSDVYSWGSGVNYTLGTGAVGLQGVPGYMDHLRGMNITTLAAAKFHSAAVAANGDLYTWGFGRGGRLGHAEQNIHEGQEAVILPRRVAGLLRNPVRCVAAAKHHTVACVRSGEVYTWGMNREGQLGYSGLESQPVPRKVSALKGVACAVVAAANRHSAAVSCAGVVFTWGSNSSSQLGYSTSDSCSHTPRRVESIGDGRRAVHVSASKFHTAISTADGDVLTWGYKQGIPRKVTLGPAAKALAGATDRHRALGSGHSKQRLFASTVSAGATHSVVVTRCGVTLCWASGDPSLRCMPVPTLLGKRVVLVATGKMRSAAVTAEGDVWMWEGVPRKVLAGDGDPTPLKPGSPSPAYGASPARGSMPSSSPGRGFSPLGAGLSSLSRNDAAGCGHKGAEVRDVTRVAGIKRAVAVAVGEKHSLALTHTHVPRPASPFLAGSTTRPTPGEDSGTSGALAEQDDSSEDEDRAWTADMDMEPEDCGEGAARSVSRDAWTSMADKVAAAALKSQGFSAQPSRSVHHEEKRSMSIRGRPGDGMSTIPSLRALAENAVAKSLDLRNAICYLGEAEYLDAKVLKSCSMRVILNNLDAMITVGGAGVLTELPSYLLKDMEAEARAHGGRRATSAPPLPEECDDDADVFPIIPGSAVSPSGSPFQWPGGEPSWADLGSPPVTSRTVADESPTDPGAAARQIRALRKKLQQIDALESRRQAGHLLNEQQTAKVLRRQELLNEIDALQPLCSDCVPAEAKDAAIHSSKAMLSWNHTPSADSSSLEVAPCSSTYTAKRGKKTSKGATSADSKQHASQTDASGSSSKQAAVSENAQNPATSGYSLSTSEAQKAPGADGSNAQLQPELGGVKPVRKWRKGAKGNLSLFLQGELELPRAGAKHAPASQPEPVKTWAPMPCSRSFGRTTSLAEIQSQQVHEPPARGARAAASGGQAQASSLPGVASSSPGSSRAALSSRSGPWVGAAPDVEEGEIPPEGPVAVPLFRLVKKKGKSKDKAPVWSSPKDANGSSRAEKRVAGGAPGQHRSPSLKDIQLEQERRQLALASSPGNALSSAKAAAGESTWGSASKSAENAENRWYLPEQIPTSSLISIQKEEKAIKELRQMLGKSANIRIVSSSTNCHS